MNCPDWEEQIASEVESAGLEEHLQGCERCRDFAHELEENRKALGELTVPAAAFDAVRLRVLSEIQAKKRRMAWWAWSAVAAAACVTILCVSLVLSSMRNPAVPRMPHLAVNASEIERTPMHLPVAAQAHHVRHIYSGRLAVKTAPAEPLVVKMLTDDPNVIIIWLVNEKGDEL